LKRMICVEHVASLSLVANSVKVLVRKMKGKD
jgi:hypothetical protein